MAESINWTPSVTYTSEVCTWIENVLGGPNNITSYTIFQLVEDYRNQTYPNPTAQDVLGCVYYYRGDISGGNQYTGCTFTQ